MVIIFTSEKMVDKAISLQNIISIDVVIAPHFDGTCGRVDI